jgi:outer membrane protein OmpA-like peptidoglycan-associated protein
MSVAKEELLATRHDQEEHWLSVSDLMAGLMMIFMLIAIVYMIKVETEAEVAILYDHLKNDLYNDLHSTFKDDLTRWNAELYRDLTIRFKEPDVLFDQGRDEIKLKFQAILSDFFPRYIAIITSDKYRNDIEEIRIEGHTSSIWNNKTSDFDGYILNMALSQDRTRSTLDYVLSLESVISEVEWLKAHTTANGLSSSKLIHNEDGSENPSLSRRVEFRVKTNAEARIAKIIEASE